MGAFNPFYGARVKRTLSQFMIGTFVWMSVVPPGAVSAQARGVELPAPQELVRTSAGYQPAAIKGLVIHPENPLEFDFIIDAGDSGLSGDLMAQEANRLVKYFLTALTIPENELWVNLSPYEQNRVIADQFGKTEMGRDLLAQDYILKQLTASLMYPEQQLGQRFWDRVYRKTQAQFGTTEIPMNTFNKVWIVPESATIYQKDVTAFVLQTRLKVMLEEDYKALEANQRGRGFDVPETAVADTEIVSGVSAEIIRDIIIPEIEKEVNNGEHFAPLRQIYSSLILATWYKMNLKESLLGKVYVDQNKTRGVDLVDRSENERIYEQYLTAFKKGVYNYIKEDYDPATEQVVPRRYFSGGGDLRQVQNVVRQGTINANNPVDGAVLATIRPYLEQALQAKYLSSTVRLYDVGEGASRTDIDQIQNYGQTDQSMLSQKRQNYQALNDVLADGSFWSQIQREVILHVERNQLGVDGQQAWFRDHFADWVNAHLTGPENAGRRSAVLEHFAEFMTDVNMYKWSINQAYKFDLGFMNVAREYLHKLNEFERLNARSHTVVEEVLAFSSDEQIKSLVRPLVDGELPVFADAVLESLIPALAREGNDPNAQVALGAGGLGFLDGETIAGVKKYLKGNWGATDGYAGISALPLYEVFQRRTIPAQEIDWDNQQDIKPFMVTDQEGRRRHMKFNVNFSGTIHDTPRMMHKRNDLQKKLKLSAYEVNKYWDKLLEMGVIDEVSKRGQINDNIEAVLRAQHQDFDGREREIYNLLASLRSDPRPAGQDYEVEVYIVDNEGTPQFTMRAPKFDIFHHLYPGGNQQWIQYAFYGKAYVQLLRELGVAPDVLMLNEGQTVFVAIEMVNDINRARLLGTRSMFEDVKIVYKTHTPNPAALPIYEDVGLLRRMLGWDMVPDDLLTYMYNKDHFYAPKALADLADLIIAVSDENARVARRIIVPGFDVEGAQNGSLPQDWYPDALAELVEAKGYEGVTGEELYAIRRKAKLGLNDNLRRLLGDVMGDTKVPQFAELEGRPLIGLLRRMVRYKGQGMLIPLVEWIVGDQDTQYFDFNDKLLGYGQGANLLIGGEAQDEYGEEWVARFKRMQNGAFTKEDLAEMDNLTIDQINEVWDILKRDGFIQESFGAAVPAGNWQVLDDDGAVIQDVAVKERYRGYNKYLFKLFRRMNNLKGKVIYIEKTGKNVMKAATTAVDLWLNMPDPTQEASGTSHQRVGLAGGLNVGVLGAGYDIQITHGVNGWLINAFPNVNVDELIDMFNVGVKSEFKQRVIRNMYEYWNRARPQLRNYIAEAVQIYRDYDDGDAANSRWTEMLKSAFDQAHETVTIEHNNIRNKMAFDAALDGSGTQGIRRRKQLGEHILNALGPVINALTRSRLEGVSAEETMAHIQDLGWYLVKSDGMVVLSDGLQPYVPALVDSRQQIIAEIVKSTRDADAVRKLITEELAVDVTYRVQRAMTKSDKAILVVDDDVADEPIGGYDRFTLEKYHAVDGHVTLIESTYDGKSDQTTHRSVGLRGVVPYFVILEDGNQTERGTEAIMALYERGGYRSEASTNVKKTASLAGREISLLSRYDAQSNTTTHSFAGIKDGPRRDRLPAFVLTEPEPGFFALRNGQEIMALRAKGFYPDAAVLSEERQAEIRDILNFEDPNPQSGGLFANLFFDAISARMMELTRGDSDAKTLTELSLPLNTRQMLEGYRNPIERVASVGRRYIVSLQHRAVVSILSDFGIDTDNQTELDFVRQQLEDDRLEQIRERITPALESLLERMSAAGLATATAQDLLARYQKRQLDKGIQDEVTLILKYGHELQRQRLTGIDPDYPQDIGLVLAELNAMADQALTAPTKTNQKYGGIDLNPKLLNLQIKRDGAGIPLPMGEQPFENIHIEGFVPVIINIVPLNNLPLILGWDRQDVNDREFAQL